MQSFPPLLRSEPIKRDKCKISDVESNMEFVPSPKKPRLDDEITDYPFPMVSQRRIQSNEVRISNLPPSVSSHSLKFFLSSRLDDKIDILECLIQKSLWYARVTLASENQARLVLGLNGTWFGGAVLQVQPWEPHFRYPISSLSKTTSAAESSSFPNTNVTSDTNSVSSTSNVNAPTHSAPSNELPFSVKREECAIFVRNLPPNICADDLKLFLKKRIQLAFKELISDIQILTCHLFKGGSQAFIEFLHRRHAIRALSLKNKTFQGQPLDLFQWENRLSRTWDVQDEDGLIREDEMDIPMPNHPQSRVGGPFAVYINHLPEKTSSQNLKIFLTETMKVAYKEAPTIVACSVRPSPRNDAYVEFNCHEQVNQAVNLRSRTFEGRSLNIIPWDKTFKILYNEEEDRNEHKFATNIQEVLGEHRAVSNTAHGIQSHEGVVGVGLSRSPSRDYIRSSDHENRDPVIAAPKQTCDNVLTEDVRSKALEDPRMMNILQRQLDAMRLDRDHWKSAHDQCQKNLQQVTVELASTRAEMQLKSAQEPLHGAGLRDSDVDALRQKLRETEGRFKNVADSLSQQTNIMNAIIQENQSLKAQLSAERKRREAVESGAQQLTN